MSLGRFLHRQADKEELAREIEEHIAREAEEYEQRGLSAEEARRQALLKFGNPTRVHEQVWESNTVRTIESVLHDMRYAIRTLRRTPGFTIIAVLVMALGIGSLSAIFCIVRSVLLQPLPFRDPDRLVMLYEQSADGKSPYNVVAAGMFAAWQEHNHGFEQMALFSGWSGNLSGDGRQLPEKITGAASSWNFFSTLGVTPAYGRAFLHDDENLNAANVVVLSWGLWKRRFGGDSSLINHNIMLDGRPYNVIGIMPAWFSYPHGRVQLWTLAYRERSHEDMQVIDDHEYSVIARLAPGFSMTSALSEIDLLEKRIHNANPTKLVGQGANARPLLEATVGYYKVPLYVLLAATGCVLLIACLNVASLLVARSAARRRDVAIRTALGGSRFRLFREQLTESLFLSLLGGCFGLVLADLALRWVVSSRQDMVRVDAIHMDGAILIFAAAISILSGILAGLFLLFGGNANILQTLQESARAVGGGLSRARLRKALLAAEVGLTVVLLIGAGLLLRSYLRLRTQDIGCRTENVLTMRLGLPGEQYRDRVQVLAFFERLITSVRALPGVDQAGLVNTLPGAGYGGDDHFVIPEHPPLKTGEFQYAIFRSADPGYFAAMQIPMLRGRSFTGAERLDRAQAVIISDMFAKTFFVPGEDPLGKHIQMHGATKDRVFEIVGIAGNTRYWLQEDTQPMMYFPIYDGTVQHTGIVVHAQRHPEGLALPIQKLIASMDPDIPVSDVLTMDQVIGRSTADASFNAVLVLAFSILSLVLAAVGLYGVLSYLVTQRTAEIGIRLALGAQRSSVVGLMLRDGLKPVLLGLLCGLAGGAMATQLIREMLFGIRPLDAETFIGVAIVLGLVAGTACILPAWRASRLDAMQALRSE